MKNALGCLFQIAYAILGLIQFAAIIGFLHSKIGGPFIVSIIASLLISYIPLAGTICGILGAIFVWKFAVWQSLLLFLGPYATLLIVFLIASFFDKE